MADGALRCWKVQNCWYSYESVAKESFRTQLGFRTLSGFRVWLGRRTRLGCRLVRLAAQPTEEFAHGCDGHACISRHLIDK